MTIDRIRNLADIFQGGHRIAVLRDDGRPHYDIVRADLEFIATLLLREESAMLARRPKPSGENT